MKNLFVYILLVFAIVGLFAFAYSFAQEEVTGDKIFVEKKCGTCHSVESSNITSKKKDAVDLSDTGKERTADFFNKYLNKQEKINDKEHKTAFKGTEAELKVLSEWLAGLKVENK
jgi:hypothetical protein